MMTTLQVQQQVQGTITQHQTSLQPLQPKRTAVNEQLKRKLTQVLSAQRQTGKNCILRENFDEHGSIASKT